MSVYIGFYRPCPEYRADAVARARRGEETNPEIVRLIREFPGALPDGCRLVGAYTTMSTSHPNLLILDTGDTSDLDFVTRYYRGYLEFDWVPGRVLGVTDVEREEYLEIGSSSSV